MSKIKPEDFDAIVCGISKNCIENSNFDEVQIFFETILQEPVKFENKLYLMITGYDDDPRELFEIDEVRQHLSVLDRIFPYWFYFLDKKEMGSNSPMVVITSLLVPLTEIKNVSGKKFIEFEIEKLKEFIDVHLHYLNELTDKIKLSEEENMRITQEVQKCFMSFV